MILIDTDVLIDLALDRHPHAGPATELIDFLEIRRRRAFVAWHSLANFYYLVSPTRGRKSTQEFLDDILLNAPKHKFGASVKYENETHGLDARLRIRASGDAPVSAGVLGSGVVEGFTVLDLTLGYEMPFDRRFKVTMSVQNLLDNRHREFIGTPEIGRLGILRLQYFLEDGPKAHRR